MTIHAFNFAEHYRTPVFVLSNREIGMTREAVDLDRIEIPALVERRRPPPGTHALPHQFDRPGDVPPFADFGGEHVTRFTTSTHDQGAFLSTGPEVTQAMIDHCIAKIEAAPETVASYIPQAAGALPFCPGCGQSLLLRELDRALVLLQLDPDRTVIVTDIGCISTSRCSSRTTSIAA